MGIPKFYRWTSERYPCLSERIKEYQIPEFDNLYLDMNGIIHNCSHPNDEDIHLRIPEQQIFKDIFHYIDFLFKMIKPCKVFFMAIDGVAPRAKMNQQRGRRFRSARLAEDQEAEAVRKGETLPSEERFDSNCITPGTEFMARLHEQLKYFVQVKVSTDPLWQRSGLVIYLSGHDVPGEGEHKIMDFIRHLRSQPDYDPVRHCLYGLDADLVMLGLSTHEFQFSLLREEVKFSRPKKPKKGMKRSPPKPSTEITSYDLTNVSIFKNDDVSSVPAESVQHESSIDRSSGLIVDGQSFLNALTKPAETATVVMPPQTVEKSDNNENQIEPPPPDDSKAKGVYKAPLPEKTTFLLLHLSLMRDYIDFEFQELQKNLENHPTIVYNLENVIDDWILMNILVGNDFVPHLPHFHIVKGALPMLYQIYTDVLPTLDGYINENGILNLKRFEVFINQLSQFDIETFKETYDDMKYMESKTGKNIVLGEKMFEGFEFGEDAFVEESLEELSPELKALAKRTEEEVFGETKDGSGNLCTELFNNDDNYFQPDDSPELRMEFLQHKRNYYISKLELNKITPAFLESFCKEFIRAIQWVLLYYYKGVSSWGWFYPYHYAPFCSDLKNFANFEIEFDKGQPFRPFEQLLAVLPAQSKKLLPGCYQWLMTDTESPIVDFYPQKFEQDLNGKKQDWEAVVLIPFIEEFKLLDVMKNEETNLSLEEAHRNSKGLMMLYSYSVEDTGPVRSPGDIFPVLDTSHVKIETMGEVTYNPLTLPKGIHPKAKKDVIYQGFPTLKSKPIKAVIEKAEIKVFEFVTREESMIISLEDINDKLDDIVAFTRKLIGRSVWVNWPHLTYAHVTAVLTRQGKYFQDGRGNIVQDDQLIGSRIEKEFDSIAKGLIQRHLKCKGIKLDKLNVIVYAKMMEGRKIRCDKNGNVQFETLWSNLQQPFALKTCMYEENITEIFYLDKNLATNYMDLYKKGDQVFYLGDKNFGALGTVTDHNKEQRSVVVDLEVSPGGDGEINLTGFVGNNSLKSHNYYTSYVAAGKCQISSYVLSRLTGTVFVSIEKETKAHKKMLAKKNALLKGAAKVLPSLNDSSSSDEDFPALEMKKINVGLDLKFNKKNLEVRGYTSKRDGAWFYSEKAVQLVNDYVMKFSDFVGYLSRVEKGRDVFEASELFPTNPLERINEMVEWLEDNGVRDLPRISTNTNLLDDEDIDTVWKHVLKHKNLSKPFEKKRWTAPPNLLLKPGIDRGCVPPIPHSTYNILDRVVCIDRGAPIPIGRRGTIVGIQIPQSSEPEQIEESFKSTGAATLMTLIVLCDPAPDVFDDPRDFIMENTTDAMTNSLASLLRITDSSKSRPTISDNKASAQNKLSPDLRPRLIKLYPYQLLNVTQGPALLRQSHNDSKRLRNSEFFPMNGHVRPSNGNQMTQLDFSMAKPVQGPPVRIIQRPTAEIDVEKKQKQFVAYDSSKVVQSLKPNQQKEHQQGLKKKAMPNITSNQKLNVSSSKSSTRASNNDVLSWPPQPLMNATPLNEPFSVAAYLQMQFNASPITKPNVEPHATNKKNPPPPAAKKEAQIFSSQTRHHPPPTQNSKVEPSTSNFRPPQKQQQRDAPDILQMLNKASDNFNFGKLAETSAGSGGHPSTIIPSLSSCRPPAPPPSWVSSSQPLQPNYNSNRKEQAFYVPRSQNQQNWQGAFPIQPAQPQYHRQWQPNANKSCHQPEPHYNRQRQPENQFQQSQPGQLEQSSHWQPTQFPTSTQAKPQTLPQHHFVPLQVSRNSAPKRGGGRQKNPRLSYSKGPQEAVVNPGQPKPGGSQQQSTPEGPKVLPVAVNCATANDTANSSILLQFASTPPQLSEDISVASPESSNKSRSRLAANFGNL